MTAEHGGTDHEIAVETWQLSTEMLPRVKPTGWCETTDRLRETMCLLIETAVNGVESVEPYEGRATERERYRATLSTDEVDHDRIEVVTASATDGPPTRHEGESTTETFDVDDALSDL